MVLKFKERKGYFRLLADGSIWNVSMTRCVQKVDPPAGSYADYLRQLPTYQDGQGNES